MINLSSPCVMLPAVLAAALLSACSAQTVPEPSASGAASAPTAIDSAAKAEAAPAVPRIPGNLTALGTEPFWSAQITGDILTYTTPETPDGIKAPVERSDQSDGTSFAAALDDKALVLEVKNDACSDGMSDTVYPMTVTLLIDGDPQQGCAR